MSTAATNSTVSAPFTITSKTPIQPTPRVTLSSLTINNVGTLRALNSAIFPVSYSDKYYTEVLESSMEDFNKLVYYADVPVGSITCRFESSPASSPSTSSPLKLHILTLNVLPAYRSQGLGAHLLSHVVEKAGEFPPPAPAPAAPKKGDAAKKAEVKKVEVKERETRKVESVFVHCQVGNEEGKKFYQRGGFEEAGVITNYYSKIEPRDALRLEKNIN
ncbi:hypothetical protein BDY24DRAFT_369155 [Mrakia frigida]|uniref:GNAT family N-acetyltransferase n=1 Tax=Mrakia frigida TaxID=29902 RepID=UPI003FCBF3F9